MKSACKVFAKLSLCFTTMLILASCGGTAPVSVTANPPPASYQLTVSPPASGSGTITSSPSGISCPGTCAATFAASTQVILSAKPSAGFFFTGWGGSCSGTTTCDVTLAAAANVSANFSAGLVLSVVMAGAGTGAVTSSPAGLNCPTLCSASFAPGAVITLSETPSANNAFYNWSGACSGATACSVTLTASNSVTATFGGTLQSLNHFIVFAQENRSLDHYFGYLRQYWANTGTPDQSFDGLPQFNPVIGVPPAVPGCDPTQPFPAACLVDAANPITSFHFQSVCQENQSPFWNESHNQWNYADPIGSNPADLAAPALNGFAFTAAYNARTPLPSNPTQPQFMDTNGVRAMGYFQDSELNYYYFMATNFGTSDRWFAPVMSRSQPNREYMFAATSGGHAYPAGGLSATTIFEELQNAGLTWKIYVNPQNTGCASTDSACLIADSYINSFTYETTILNTPSLLANIVSTSQFTTDAQNGTLPQFAFIEPASTAGLDEHPSDSDPFPVNVQTGAAYASGLINTLMTSPSWTDSVMIFTYDEPGGYYDHVPPQSAVAPGDFASPTDLLAGDICSGTGELGTGMCDFSWTGYRVPTIVISPYSVKNFVSHNVRDHTAILKMVETRFGLPSLTQRDAAQFPMDEFFDFVNKPWATPPSPPVQSTAGVCNLAPPV